MENKKYWFLTFSSDCNCGTSHSIQAFNNYEDAISKFNDIFDDCLDCAHVERDSIEFNDDGLFDGPVESEAGDTLLICDLGGNFYLKQTDREDYYFAHGAIEYINPFENNVISIV